MGVEERDGAVDNPITRILAEYNTCSGSGNSNGSGLGGEEEGNLLKKIYN